MRIKLPATRKGRIWASVGTAVAVISIVGTIGDATRSDDERRYDKCMEAYHNAAHCYEDVYGQRGASLPSVGTGAPTDIPLPAPATPTTTATWDPFHVI